MTKSGDPGLPPDAVRVVPSQTASAVGAPMLSMRGLALAFVMSIFLCWPMLLVTAPLGYFDTLAYLRSGETVINLAANMLIPQASAPPESVAGAQSGMREDAPKARQSRSFIYSAYLYLGSLVPGGLVAATIIQTMATLLVLFAFFTTAPRAVAAILGALGLGAFTTLPWFASYAMPDILAAAVILFYALLASGIGHVGTGWRFALGAICCFGVVSHYGHVPLAFGLMLTALACCALRRALTFAILALAALPLVLAVGLNLIASTVALDGPSLAPKRLPILLARSIDDGPAAWHLADACPEADYAICDIFPGGVPTDIHTFLWSDQGIASATSAELDAIRAEEGKILWNTFQAYPVEQTRSLFGNFGKQMVSIGTDDVNPLLHTAEPGGFVSATSLREGYLGLAWFDHITFWGTFAATCLASLLWMRGPLRPGAGWALGLCLFGLMLNALIFGGLSAPVDRYQSRVAWAFPALALVFLLDGFGRAVRSRRL